MVYLGAQIARSALNLSCFCSVEALLTHMLDSSRFRRKELGPGRPLPFVGREQDVEWFRKTVGKRNECLEL